MKFYSAASLLVLSATVGVKRAAAFAPTVPRSAVALKNSLSSHPISFRRQDTRAFMTDGDANVAAEAPHDDDEKPKKKKKKKQPPPAPPLVIDVSKLDIRVGVITKAWLHEEADKLFCEEIDVGEEAPRQIASGLRAHYELEDLEGQRVLVLANLKTRKLMGFPSHGMVMCAANADEKVVFVEPPADAEIGERIMVDGFDGEPATENQVIKKKMLDAIFPDLKTDGEGVATYKGKPFTTAAGVCQAQGGMANAEIA